MLTEEQWQTLTDKIRRKQCTPFLGAGACYGILPLGEDVAAGWAKDFEYPFDDKKNLIRVSQFVALKSDSVTPKNLILDQFKKATPPRFDDPYETHRALADLRLPIYLTTNYDGFMTGALQHREMDAEREFYRWNRYLKEFLVDPRPVFEREPGYVPSPARPLVFHLHGSTQAPDSLVLLEDDYIDFLINTSQPQYALPAIIKRALTGSSLLFIGYSIADWNFRVLLGSLSHNSGASLLNVAVMPLPKSDKASTKSIEEYLTQHYRDMNVVVHWATARDFLKELRQRLDR